MLLGNVAQFCVLFPPLVSFLVVLYNFWDMHECSLVARRWVYITCTTLHCGTESDTIALWDCALDNLHYSFGHHYKWLFSKATNIIAHARFCGPNVTSGSLPQRINNVQCSCLFNEVKAFWKIYFLWSVLINKCMGNTSHNTTTWAQLLSTYHFNCVCSLYH